MIEANSPATIIVTGATGYVGGRLVPKLLEAGFRVRCLGRSISKLRSRSWSNHPRLQLGEVDFLDQASLASGMRVAHAAYYLVHSMQSAGASYAETDRALAQSFAEAAASAGVRRVIYLGGLGEEGEGLSKHLASRRDVEAALRSTDVPVTVFRAAMIIGSGSASFEILRYLVQRLPVMITPKWVRTECQPIAIRNVINYLVMCLNSPETIGNTLDIGGRDVMTYQQIMNELADSLGLPARWVVPIPILTPRLSSLWIHLVTPISQHLARPLAEGLRNRVVCRDERAQQLMPQPLLSVREAIDAAIARWRGATIETAWSDAGPIPGDPDWAGGTVFTDQRTITIAADAETVFRAVCSIGGSQGYYAADWLWRIRGAMDRLIGGPGLRRGRRHPESLSVGDALDFWRVRELIPGKLLRLIAEMKLPGIAELSFEVQPSPGDAHTTRLVQTARFKPRGLLGLAYWYTVLPLHRCVFSGMLRGLAAKAELRTTVCARSAAG